MISEQHLRDFVESLRDHGFEIGVDTHLRALMLWHKVRPRTPKKIEKFKYQITPLLATSEEEQELCYHLYDISVGNLEFEEMPIGMSAFSEPDKPAASRILDVILRDHKGKLRIRAFLLLGVFGLLIGGYFWAMSGDADWIPQPLDNCPDSANFAQADLDGDGIGDVCDICPGVPAINGQHADDDADFVGNVCDNCPDTPNEGQADNDGDLIGNACDNCPNDSIPDQSDRDGDGIGDSCDNCPDLNSENTGDRDGDGLGDACDPDIDNDSIPNEADNAPYEHNPDQADTDGDGWPDVIDLCPEIADDKNGDMDLDGVGDVCDICPTEANREQNPTDLNRNGIPDECEEARDNFELPPPFAPKAPNVEHLEYNPFTDNLTNIILWVLLGLLGVIIIALIWVEVRFRDKRKTWKRDASKGAFYYRVSADARRVSVFTDDAFLELTRLLKRRREGEHRHFNIDKTIKHTRDNAGFVKWVFDPAMHASEYLILIKRNKRDDHEAHFYKQLCTELSREQVHVSAYFYSEDARICKDVLTDRAVDLRDLIILHPRHRLLVFGDAGDFFDPITGLLPKWHKDFDAWPERALFIREEPDEKDYFQAVLSEHWLVLPASEDSIDFMIRHFWGEQDEWSSGTTALTDHIPERPDEANVAALKDYLGDDMFQWLCALAVYPDIDWQLTLQLGEELQPDGSWHHSDKVIKLVRLPWFREGRIPQEWRSKLISLLEEPHRSKTHELLTGLLDDDRNRVDKDSFAYNKYALEMGTHKMASDKRRGEAYEEGKQWLKTIHPRLIAEDEIAAGFVRNAEQPRWSKLVPKWLKKRWFYGGIPYLGWRDGVPVRLMFMLLPIAILMLLFVMSNAPETTTHDDRNLYLNNQVDSGQYFALLAYEAYMADNMTEAIRKGYKATEMDTSGYYHRYALTVYLTAGGDFRAADAIWTELGELINNFSPSDDPNASEPDLSTDFDSEGLTLDPFLPGALAFFDGDRAEIVRSQYAYGYIQYNIRNFPSAQINFQTGIDMAVAAGFTCDTLDFCMRVGAIASEMEWMISRAGEIFELPEGWKDQADKGQVLRLINRTNLLGDCSQGTSLSGSPFLQEWVTKLNGLSNELGEIFREPDNTDVADAANNIDLSILNPQERILFEAIPFKGYWETSEGDVAIRITNNELGYNSSSANELVYFDGETLGVTQQYVGEQLEVEVVLPALGISLKLTSVDGSDDRLILAIMDIETGRALEGHGLFRAAVPANVPQKLQTKWYGPDGAQVLEITDKRINNWKIIQSENLDNGDFRAIAERGGNYNGYYFREIKPTSVRFYNLFSGDLQDLDGLFGDSPVADEDLTPLINDPSPTEIQFIYNQGQAPMSKKFIDDSQSKYIKKIKDLGADAYGLGGGNFYDPNLESLYGEIVIRYKPNKEFFAYELKDMITSDGYNVVDYVEISEQDQIEIDVAVEWTVVQRQKLSDEFIATLNLLAQLDSAFKLRGMVDATFWRRFDESIAFISKDRMLVRNFFAFSSEYWSSGQTVADGMNYVDRLNTLFRYLKEKNATPLQKQMAFYALSYQSRMMNLLGRYVEGYEVMLEAKSYINKIGERKLKQVEELEWIAVQDPENLKNKLGVLMERVAPQQLQINNSNSIAGEEEYKTLLSFYHASQLFTDIAEPGNTPPVQLVNAGGIRGESLNGMLQVNVSNISRRLSDEKDMGYYATSAYEMDNGEVITLGTDGAVRLSNSFFDEGVKYLSKGSNASVLSLNTYRDRYVFWEEATRKVYYGQQGENQFQSKDALSGSRTVVSVEFNESESEVIVGAKGTLESDLVHYGPLDENFGWGSTTVRLPAFEYATWVGSEKEVALLKRNGDIVIVDSAGNERYKINGSAFTLQADHDIDGFYSAYKRSATVYTEPSYSRDDVISFGFEPNKVAFGKRYGPVAATNDERMEVYRWGGDGPSYVFTWENILTPGTSVTHVSITNDNNYVIMSCDNGRIYKLPITRKAMDKVFPFNNDAKMKVNDLLLEYVDD